MSIEAIGTSSTDCSVALPVNSQLHESEGDTPWYGGDLVVVHVRDREPVRIMRQAKDDGGPATELTGRRFMGTLLHPVPPGDMQKQFGVFRRGHRISVEWPASVAAEYPVQAGDSVEVGGRTYQVRGCVERPGCYLDLYVEDM